MTLYENKSIVLGLRAAQVLFAIIVLGTAAYGT